VTIISAESISFSFHLLALLPSREPHFHWLGAGSRVIRRAMRSCKQLGVRCKTTLDYFEKGPYVQVAVFNLVSILTKDRPLLNLFWRPTFSGYSQR